MVGGSLVEPTEVNPLTSNVQSPYPSKADEPHDDEVDVNSSKGGILHTVEGSRSSAGFAARRPVERFVVPEPGVELAAQGVGSPLRRAGGVLPQPSGRSLPIPAVDRAP
jgi:hypothetical protein